MKMANDIMDEIRHLMASQELTAEKVAFKLNDKYGRSVRQARTKIREYIGDLATWDSSEELTSFYVQLHKAEYELHLVRLVFMFEFSIDIKELGNGS